MKSALEEYLLTITGDESLSIERRIEEVMALRRDEGDENDENEYERLEENALIYSSLIDMLRDKDKDYKFENEQMQLLVLLAETLDEQERYRPMEIVADYTLSILRNELLSVEMLKQTIPRMADAISQSVFRHSLYDILLRYLRLLHRNDSLSKKDKKEAESLLRLHILLSEKNEDSYLLNRDLQHALAALFTSEELMAIIMHPEKGLHSDQVEYTLRWEEIYYDLEDELNERFANAPRQMGFCFYFWSAKAKLLKEKYNIEWRTPSQMNPHVMFD